ncbi:hypothetical protein [Vibrio furnissii]|uniref:hypothetical protein n=1 Tax=Vibrio furnissii TaxID=29494 RepID=UPI000200DB31|nr:hypothetical protein [Vibrio furnissii]ADT89685.1 ABC transporter, ATP-binding protein [Vibrio furnissii NCTC 11218]
MPDVMKNNEDVARGQDKSEAEKAPVSDKPKSKEISNLATSIIVALITSVSTTAGMFYLTSYQKKVDQENWLEQQRYNEAKEEKSNLTKLVSALMKLNSEVRTLKMDRNSLYFQSQAILLKPNMIEEIRLSYINEISQRLTQVITKEKQVSSELTLKLSAASIFSDEDIGDSIVELFKSKLNKDSVVNELLDDFREKVMNKEITSEEFDVHFANYTLKASESAVDFEYEEKFNKTIKLIVVRSKSIGSNTKHNKLLKSDG